MNRIELNIDNKIINQTNLYNQIEEFEWHNVFIIIVIKIKLLNNFVDYVVNHMQI